VLFVECDSPIPASAASLLDEKLFANPHYAYCRRLGQLAAARIVRVEGAAAVYLEAYRQSGQRLGNIKPTPLHAAHHWPAVFSPHIRAD
jgi:hypothetical protein